MKSTLIIARRELTERRFIFLAAFAFCVLALLMPFMPGVRDAERRNALVMASCFLSIAFTLGLSAALGATIVGRELTERRLSFYFSKPVDAVSIWFGKLIAALALIGVCFGIIAAPALVAGVGTIRVWINASDAPTVTWVVLATAVGLFLVAHVIGTIVRARSAWIVFDFIAAAVCAVAIGVLGRALLLGRAVELTRRLGEIFLVFAAIAIVAAGAWQLANGRTDRKRSHMELSRFLWASLGSGLLLIAAYVLWVVSITPKDLRVEFAEQASSGSWVIFGGTAKNAATITPHFSTTSVPDSPCALGC